MSAQVCSNKGTQALLRTHFLLLLVTPVYVTLGNDRPWHGRHNQERKGGGKPLTQTHVRERERE